MARISDIERIKRLHEISALNDEGLSDSKIADKLSVDIMVIKRGQRYLEELGRADLTPEVLAGKRSELYLELESATEEAKRQYDLYSMPIECRYCSGSGYIDDVVCSKCHGVGSVHKPVHAERFLRVWLDMIERKAKLYGLDNIKSESTFQQFNFSREYEPDVVIPSGMKHQAKVLAKAIKDSHESKLRKAYEEGL